MFVVAIAEVAGDPEAEAGPIGAILGVDAFDARQRVRGLLPRVVYRSSSEEDALRVAAALRARRHGVMTCDMRDVVASDAMVHLSRFSFDATWLWADGPGSDRLAFDEIAALVLVTARSAISHTTVEVVPQSDGGTRVVETSRTEAVTEREAYLFPRAALGERPPRPWLVRESSVQYAALGASMRPTRRENFRNTVALLRERAPRAVCDDRFNAGQYDRHYSGLDLTVHLLGRWLLFGRGGPYR